MAGSNVAQETLNKVATTLPEALAKIIDTAVNGLDAGINFLSTQIPDVIHQLLLYNAVWSFMWWLFALIGMIAVISINAYVWTRTGDKEWGNDEARALFFFSVIVMMPLIATFACNWDWLKIWLAPKIYLIEYAAALS